MKKKYGLFKVLTILLLLVVVATYFFESRSGNTQFLAIGDVVLNYVQSFYYFFDTAIFIFVVGGFYGFLSRVPAYRKLVEGIAKIVKKKSMFFVIGVTILFALVASLTGFNLLLLLFVPFVVSIILLLGYDKLVAISATIGGIFAGGIGGVFFTLRDPNSYNYVTFDKFVGLDSNWTNLFPRILLLVVVTGLLIFYIISYIKKKKDGKVKYKLTKSDSLFIEVKDKDGKVEKVDDKKVRVWPLAVTLVLLLVVLGIGYFQWQSLFDVKVFIELHTLVTGVSFAEARYVIMAISGLMILLSFYKLFKLSKKKKIFSKKSIIWFLLLANFTFVLVVFGMYSFDILTKTPFGKWVMSSILWDTNMYSTLFSSNLTGFGTWTNLGNYMAAVFVLIIYMLVLMAIYKVKFADAMEGFVTGIKKMVYPVLVAMLAYTVLVCCYNNGFMETVITNVSEAVGDNVLVHSLISIVGCIVNVDMYYVANGIFTNIVTNLTENANLSIFAVMFQSIYGLVGLVGPTSILLIIGLSYLDVPYKTWLKYIWRFIVELIIVILLVLMLVSLL